MLVRPAGKPATTGARFWVPVAMSVLAAGGAIAGVWWWTTTHQELVPAVVAARNLHDYTVLIASDLAIRNVPRGSIDPDTIQRSEDLIGKQVIEPVYKGEPFRQERVANADGVQNVGGQFRVIAREGERLVAIPVDMQTTGGGTIQAGDAVDVYLVPNGGANSSLVVAGVTVAELRTAAGALYQPGTPGSAVPAIANLRVTELQVRTVLDATGKGKLALVRRN